jgi:protein SCO1/2
VNDMNVRIVNYWWAAARIGIAILLLGLSDCLGAQKYPVRGLLLQVDLKNQSIVVSQESIPGYMEAMRMPYHIASTGDLDRLRAGSVIQFTLTVDGDQSSVSGIRVLAFDSVDREPLEARSLSLVARVLGGKTKAAEAINIGQHVPDFTLVDQTGMRVSLSEFAGKVVAVTFVYTRCPLPDYCLRLSNNFGRLQKRFVGRIGTDLVLLSITFDPAHDSPEVLANYGEIWKADPKGWHLLTGSDDEVKRVSNLFGSNFWPDEGTVTHSLHTFVIDRKGQLAANIEGNRFTSDQLGDLVQSYF